MTKQQGILQIKLFAGEVEDLKTIKKTTASVEAKLFSLLTRVTEVKERVSELEDTLAGQKDNPPVMKADLEEIFARSAPVEDRSRRNSLRFVGIAEGVEGKDTLGLLNTFLVSVLGIDPPVGGL